MVLSWVESLPIPKDLESLNSRIVYMIYPSFMDCEDAYLAKNRESLPPRVETQIMDRALHFASSLAGSNCAALEIADGVDAHPIHGAFDMAMNTAAAYGIYSQDVVLADIVRNLNQAGFENESICMMLSPEHPIASSIRDASLFNAEKSSAMTTRLIGWLSEFGAVMIPTVGFFIRSQVFFHALMVARDAPALCGNARTLVGLGFTEEEAERYEDQLDRLGVFVYISCADVAKMHWAREVLRHTGAQEAATLEESMSVAASA
jgi:hypothetical protein